MAIATCWNCGAHVAGPTCQRCGVAQQAGGGQGRPAYGPGGQPVVSQASVSVRSPQPAAGQPPWPGQPPMPGQGGWQGYQQPGYQQGYQQPMPGQMYQGMQPAGPTFTPAQGAATGTLALMLGLPLVSGGIAAVIGAIIWAFILQATKTNFTFLALGLGLLVGFGVLLGAFGRRHALLALLAAVLGLLSFVLALYFRLSLAVADALGGGTDLFALPFGDFFDVVKLYLQDNPINYIYFVLVPLIAAGTTFRGRRR